TIVPAGPVPVTVSESVTSKSPAAFVLSLPTRVWTNTPAGSRTVSAPGVALARLIASRSDTLPSAGLTTSVKVVTVNVAGTSRASSGSTAKRRGRRAGVRDFGDGLGHSRGNMIRLLA